MITNRALFEREAEGERWSALRRLTIEETIEIAEELLTSELMDGAVFADDDRPMSLARSIHRRSKDP